MNSTRIEFRRRLIIFLQPFEVPEIFHGFENRQHVLQQRFIHRFREPLRPVADVDWIRAASDRRRDVRMSTRKLQCKFRDVAAVL